MKVVLKIFNVIAWLFTLVFQVAFGQAGGTLGAGMGQGKMPISLVYLWLMMTVGVYIVGLVAVLLRPRIHPKRLLSRLLWTCVGTAVPIAILVAVGASQGYDSQTISGGLGLILTVLATLLGILGFYIPGWKKRKS
jgi:hypothetical protein